MVMQRRVYSSEGLCLIYFMFIFFLVVSICRGKLYKTGVSEDSVSHVSQHLGVNVHTCMEMQYCISSGVITTGVKDK